MNPRLRKHLDSRSRTQNSQPLWLAQLLQQDKSLVALSVPTNGTLVISDPAKSAAKPIQPPHGSADAGSENSSRNTAATDIPILGGPKTERPDWMGGRGMDGVGI